MINIRYHIISITAVFLTLGIGLTLGSSFLAQVNIDTLRAQVEDVEQRIRQAQSDNDELDARVNRLDDRDDALAQSLPERLLADRLLDVPVLVVATRGTDEDLVEEATAALEVAGASVAGIWWLTDRWSLDADDEQQELGALLNLQTSDPGRLRQATAVRLTRDLVEAAAPLPDLKEDPDAVIPEATEPELVADLEDAGFVDYEARPGSGDDRVLLPGAGVRIITMSGTPPGDGAQEVLLSVLEELASEGEAPVVAVQGDVDLDVEDGPAPEDDRRTTFVGPLREGESTEANLSTVDDLDTAAGLAAMVLAVEDLATGTVGHYGVAPGAARLLPGPDPLP